MIRRLRACLVLSCLAALSTPLAAAAPDWLKSLESQPLPAHDDQTVAVQLLDETEITFQPDGTQRTLQRSAFRILRREGQSFAVATAHYDKNGKVVRMKGWALPRTGKPFEVDVRDSVETALVPGTEGSLITTARMKVMSIPAANPGNLVGYEIETLSRPTIVGETWSPQSGIPVARARLALRLPAGWNFRENWFNGPATAATPSGPGEWQWELKDLPAIKGEQSMPSIITLARHLVLSIDGPTPGLSSFRDWKEMGRWFSQLVAARSEVTSEVTRLVDSKGKAPAGIFDRIRQLSESVQRDIRYVQVTLDATGYQPRSPQEVLGSGYGDCKDKANTLRLLLEQIGVRSRLVLVNTTRGVVRPDTVPAAVFDHAVIAIQLPADVPASVRDTLSLVEDAAGTPWMLFDPTDELTPFGRVGDHLRAGMVLLVGADDSRLVAVSSGRPADNGVDRTVRMKLAADGSLSGEVKESWRGTWGSREREKVTSASQDQDLKRPVESRLAGVVPNYRIETATVSGREAIEKPFEWQYTFSARDYAKVAGDLLMVRPRVLGTKSSAFLDTGEPRVNPVAYDATHLDADVMSLEIPAGFVVESLPEAVNLDIGFAAYRSRTRVDGQRLVYERSFEQKALDVPVAKVDELRKLYEAIDMDERSLAVLKKQGAR